MPVLLPSLPIPRTVRAASLLAGLTGLAVLGGLSGCQKQENATAASAERAAGRPDTGTPAPATPAVLELSGSDLLVAQMTTAQTSTGFTGVLQAERTTSVQAPASATVMLVNARDGERVGQGETLVTLNTQDSQARVAQAEAGVAAARAQQILADSVRDRTARLYAREYVSRIEYEKALADAAAQAENVRGQQAILSIARKAVADSRIRAPLSGTISQRQVEPGMTVNPGQTLMQIVDTSVLELKGSLAPQGQSYLQTGQTVEFTLQGLPGQQFTGVVSRISPLADAGSRAITFYAQVANPDNRLRPGQFAEGRLNYGTAQSGIALPLEVIRRDASGQQTVWVLRDGRVVRQPVGILTTDPGKNQAIVTGIQSGERVVLIDLGEQAAGTVARLTR